MASVIDDPTKRTALESAMRTARWPIAIAGIFSGVISILMLVSPLYMMQIYDRVLSSGSKETLLWLTVLVALAFVAMGLLEAARSRILGRIGFWIERSVAEAVIEAIMQRRLSGGAPGAEPLRDLTSIRAFFGGGGLNALFDLPFTPLFLVALFALHPWLGVVGVCAAIVLFTIAVVNERLTRAPQKTAERYAVAAHAYVEATARNAEAVRAMGLGPGVNARWRQASDRSLGASRGLNDIASAIAALAKSLRLFVQSMTLGVGAYLAIEGEVTAGAIIAGSILLGRALAPIDQSIAVWKGVLSMRDASRRLNALLRAVPAKAQTQPLPPPKGHLSLEEVVVFPAGAGPEDRPILNRISFEVNPGEILGLVGPSGAGKSTLCQIMVGALRPTRGVVRLDGASLAFWDPADLGPHIGYIPQNVELLHGSVRDNIARLTAGEAKPVLEAAQLADVHELILRLPDGYDTLIGENGARLSAGQRQRIGLARALYGDPKLIVMDEPNANLDQTGETALIEAMKEIRARGAAIVVVAHRAGLLAQADRLLALRDGRVLFDGPRDEILEKLYGGRAVEKRRLADQRPPKPLEIADRRQ